MQFSRINNIYNFFTSRLLIQVLLATCIFLPTCFVSSSVFTIIYSAFFGYLLSTDIFGLGIRFYSKIKKKVARVHDVNDTVKPLQVSSPNPSISTSGWKSDSTEIFVHLALICVASGIAAATSIVSINSLITTATKATINTILTFVIITLLVLIKISGDLQGVYLFWGLLPNPIYSRSADRKESFIKRKRYIAYFGVFYRILLLIGTTQL